MIANLREPKQPIDGAITREFYIGVHHQFWRDMWIKSQQYRNLKHEDQYHKSL